MANTIELHRVLIFAILTAEFGLGIVGWKSTCLKCDPCGATIGCS